MPKKRNLSVAEKQHVVLLYSQLKSATKVAERCSISRSTVYYIWRHKDNDPDLYGVLEQAEDEKTIVKDTFDLIKGAQTSAIIQKGIDLLNDLENLKGEMKTRGIRGITGMIGTLTDKRVAIRDMEMRMEKLKLEKRAMQIREREMELKEKELELRISNPDAFAEVKIINDAPSYVSPN